MWEKLCVQFSDFFQPVDWCVKELNNFGGTPQAINKLSPIKWYHCTIFALPSLRFA